MHLASTGVLIQTQHSIYAPTRFGESQFDVRSNTFPIGSDRSMRALGAWRRFRPAFANKHCVVRTNVITRREIAVALAVAAVVRLPFWIETWRLPIYADLSIVGLMARHGGIAATFWGQPYGSPLESWLALPLFAVFGARTTTLRLLYFLLGLALVPLAHVLAGRLGRGAALPAAMLVACPPAYLLLLSSQPPPLYPSALVLCGLLLVLALELRTRLLAGEPGVALAFGWGVLAGLALWTHLMCASCVVPGLLALAPALRRRRAAPVALVAGGLLASAPLLACAILDGGIYSVLIPWHSGLTWQEHVSGLMLELYRPVGALLGASVPVFADQPTHLESPPWVALALALLWATVLARGAFGVRTGTAGRVVIGAAGLALLVFLIPARSAPHTVRFLTPLYLLLAVIAGAAAARAGWARAAVPALAVLHLFGAGRLLHAWAVEDLAQPELSNADIRLMLRFLEAEGINRAYAEYEPAYALTWESGERVIVSQPWNERFPRHPLPYLDEVRRARRSAWVLVPAIRSGLPSPEALEAELDRVGAVWRRAKLGSAVVYYDFTRAGARPGWAGSTTTRRLNAPPPAHSSSFELRWVGSRLEPRWRVATSGSRQVTSASR
jgi:hypothetical protein